MDLRPGAGGVQHGKQPQQRRQCGHQQRANAETARLEHRLANRHASLPQLAEETHQHEAVFHRNAQQRDEPNGRRNTQVDVEVVDCQDPAYCGEGKIQQHDRGALEGAKRAEEHHENQQQRDRNNELKPGHGTLLVLELSPPDEPVALRQALLDFRQLTASFVHEATQISPAYVALHDKSSG